MTERTCAQCGATITTGRKDKKYCDRVCSKRYWDACNAEQRRQHDQLFRERHGDRLNAHRRARRAADPEPFRAQDRKRDRREWQRQYRWLGKAASDREYRKANRDRINAYMRQYYAENPHRIAAIRHGRYARKRNAPGFASAEQIAARIDYFGGKCWMCGSPWEHIDHVKPLAAGGSNWPSNLRPACASCNCRKKDRWPYVAA